MKLRFLGVGSAFAPYGVFQTNAILSRKAEDGTEKHLMLDCGTQAQFALKARDIPLKDIEGVYTSHLHADHVGGMEWLAFSTFFNPSLKKLLLFAEHMLMTDMWHRTLSGGLDSIEGKVMDLTDYFDCHPVYVNQSFKWGGATFFPVQTVHIMAGRKIVNSYGLMIEQPVEPPNHGTLGKDETKRRIRYTADTQFAPYQISVSP